MDVVKKMIELSKSLTSILEELENVKGEAYCEALESITAYAEALYLLSQKLTTPKKCGDGEHES